MTSPPSLTPRLSQLEQAPWGLAGGLSAGGSGGPLLVVGDSQTAGRGRGANRWWTGPGSMAFSLLFDPRDWGLAGEAVPARSLAAGVAVVSAVRPALYPHN